MNNVLQTEITVCAGFAFIGMYCLIGLAWPWRRKPGTGRREVRDRAPAALVPGDSPHGQDGAV